MSVIINDTLLKVFNPADGSQLADIPVTSPEEVDRILDQANQAAENWKALSTQGRGKIINRFRKGLIARMDSLIDTICAETGKKPFEGLLEIMTSMEHMKRAVPLAKRALRREKRRSGFLLHKRAYVQYEPMGVAGIISPWNYPLILALSPVVEALLAGNPVVLKPSEQAPLTPRLLKEVWDAETDYPHVFQVIYGGGETGHHLVTSPKTHIVCFTGSTKVGRIIARDCADHLKPVILELGGKDPMIILKDADLTRSIRAAIWGSVSNAGQTCISVERIFIHESRYAEFSKRMGKLIKTMTAGKDESNHIGAITMKAGLEKIREQLNEVEKTSGMVQGTADDLGWFIPPTVVFDPPAGSKILLEETFGPVMTITPFKSIDEAVTLANSTGYGLSASVFTRNKALGREIASRLNAGSVVINDVLTGYGIADLPFGGKGLSGFGRLHGEEGLKAFCNIKSITENCINLSTELWWYGMSRKIEKPLKKIIRFYYGR